MFEKTSVYLLINDRLVGLGPNPGIIFLLLLLECTLSARGLRVSVCTKAPACWLFHNENIPPLGMQ